jgi:hypothetical protein
MLGTLVLGGFIGAIISIPFGIFVNFATPWVKSYFEKSTLSVRERRLYTLLKEYHLITAIKFDVSYAIRYCSLNITLLIVMSVIMISLSFLFLLQGESFANPSKNLTLSMIGTMFVLTLSGGYVGFPFALTLQKTMAYDGFQDKIKRKYQKLGGNLEDLEELYRDYAELAGEIVRPQKKSRKAKTGG